MRFLKWKWKLDLHGMLIQALKIPGSNSVVEIKPDAKTIWNGNMQDSMTQSSISDWSNVATSWKAYDYSLHFYSAWFQFFIQFRWFGDSITSALGWPRCNRRQLILQIFNICIKMSLPTLSANSTFQYVIFLPFLIFRI